MSSFMLFLLCSAIIIATSSAQQTRQTNIINLGSTLTPTSANNSAWFSPSRIFAFGFYQQSRGYTICIFFVSDKTIVWTANRDDPFIPNDVNVQLTNDGRLVYRQQRNQGPDTSVISPSESIGSASMLDNGNFVLYNSDSRIIWQSFDNPTNTLLPGQRLLPRQELFSSTSTNDSSKGIFRLTMQDDGNLVQYPVNTENTGQNAYYASGTAGQGSNVTLNFENDGYLYLFNGSSVIENITTGGYRTLRITYLTRLDVDGIFRVYSRSLDREANYMVLYESVKDRCAPKGLCGLNGYCVPLDQDAECRCLPGFDFVVPGNWTAGCARSFIAKGCSNEDGKSIGYDTRILDNMIWEDTAYYVIDAVTQDLCREACLNDCNCDASLFKDRQCRMQRLPVKYGRRLMNSDSYTAFVKVFMPISETTNGSGSGNKGEKDDDRQLRNVILVVGISLAVLAISILVITVIYVRRKHAKSYKRITEYGDVKLIEDVGLRAFSYADLAQVTNDFKEELGKGASGTVYKGILAESQKFVAVKRLEKELAQGDTEFQTEMKVIGKTYHRNLVRLLGYCLDKTNRLLVFEYMSNGSLADYLFKRESRPSWEDRVQIARDIARGILYLHEECESQIIHCDIKPQNILMDERGCAKISDFGLAKLLKQDQTNTYTGIRGTKGYVAPEWHQRQPVTTKADVYSFGIVLLEIVCCRKSVDWSLSEDEAILEEWVYNCYESREIKRLIGDEEEVDLRKLERMVKIGIWCIQYEASLRPTMKKVLLMLEGTVDIPVPPSPTSFLSSV